MTDDTWSQVQRLFEEAAALPPDDREAFLDAQCADNTELKAEVEALLESDPEGTRSGDLIGQAVERFASSVGSESASANDATNAENWRGKEVGAYRIIDKIAEGGMGAVFLAERADRAYEQKVAVKLISNAGFNESLKQRFIRERQILANLDHPNIARLLDGGETPDGVPYIVMEHVSGESIDTYCDRRRLTIEERLDLFSLVCDAVQYAHQNLIIHRDIKPSNILVTHEGIPKLIDFGIAKPLETGLPEQTKAGAPAMTPKHASPEQLLGEKVTTASDIYALGTVLYELLSGSFPFDMSSSSVEEVREIITAKTPPPPSEAVLKPVASTLNKAVQLSPDDIAEARRTSIRKLVKSLKGDLDAVALKALERVPSERYVTVRQLRLDLQNVLNDRPVDARVDSLSYRLSKTFVRHRAAFVGILALLALGIGAQSFHSIRLAEERDLAQQEAIKANKVATLLAEVLAAANPAQTRGTTISAENLLDHGAERIREDLAGDPELRADVLSVVGGTYRSLGLYQKAHDLVSEVIEIREEYLPPNDERLADSYYELGYADYELDKREESLAAHEKALSIYQSIYLDTPHPKVAASLREVGLLQEKFNDLESAEKYYLASLEQMETLYPEGNAETALTMTDYAGVLFRTQRYAEAEPIIIEALDIRRRLLGELHPDVAQGVNNLGVFYRYWGDLVSAERLARENIPMRIELYGEDGVRVAMARSNLAVVLFERGRPREAIEVLELAHPIMADQLSPSHEMIAIATQRTTRSMIALGDLAEARDFAAPVYDAMEAEHGLDSYDIAEFDLILADIDIAEGNLARARERLVHSRDFFTKARGEDHVNTFRPRMKLADIDAMEGRPTDAIEEYEAFLRLHQAILHEYHPIITEAQYRLGELYREVGDSEQAQAYFELAVAAWEVTQYAESPRLERARTAVSISP